MKYTMDHNGGADISDSWYVIWYLDLIVNFGNLLQSTYLSRTVGWNKLITETHICASILVYDHVFHFQPG